jgi:hypothetical protein
MSRMTTRSMTRKMQEMQKLKEIEEERCMTRSMCDLSKKRFHEDPYPLCKRQRIQHEQNDGICLTMMMFLITIVNACVFLIYCYIYHLELQFQQSVEN